MLSTSPAMIGKLPTLKKGTFATETAKKGKAPFFNHNF